MKLNDKSLSRYAASGAPPDREGVLHKKGDFHKTFQKRWFVLKGNLLFYYERKGDKDPIGVVILEGCTVELSDHEDGFTFMLNFPGSSSRTYVLSAETQEDMEAWMKALSVASYDYLKICVSEMQKSLKDLDEVSDLALMQGAVKARNTLVKSGIIMTNNSCSNIKASTLKSTGRNDPPQRHNPFNTDDSFDRGSLFSQNSVDVQPKTFVDREDLCFLDIHEELREQVIEIGTWWLQSHPDSKLCVPQNVIAAL